MSLPFAAGSVSLGLHTSTAKASGVVDLLRAQARAAIEAGFDGVTLSEHHGGFPGYAPTPTILASVLLGAMPAGWAGPSPTILPLRDPATVIEDLAWLAAAYPGRVGAGFVPGYQDRDFAIVGRPFDDRRLRFRQALATVSQALGGKATGPIAEDPAVAALADAPVPTVCGVGGPLAARLAAACGTGLLLTSLLKTDRARQLCEVYRQAGGSGPCVLVRRVWIGPPPPSFAGQLARNRYEHLRGGDASPATEVDVLVHGEPDSIADQLTSQVREATVTSLNLRIFADNAPSGELLGQIRAVGEHVLPDLLRRPPW